MTAYTHVCPITESLWQQFNLDLPWPDSEKVVVITMKLWICLILISSEWLLPEQYESSVSFNEIQKTLGWQWLTLADHFYLKLQMAASWRNIILPLAPIHN